MTRALPRFFTATTALLLAGASRLPAQAPVPIRDNSFLIEEAYNQEWGVVQHVTTFQRIRGSSDWGATFTQEWPAPGERHQLSYTVPMQRSASGDRIATGIGDVALNYRYQVPFRQGSTLAVSPRFSVLLPVGDERRGHGSGGTGVEVNLPASIAISRLIVTHFNAGGSWTPNSRNAGGDRAATTSMFLGQSVVVLVHPKLNFLVEALWSQEQSVVGEGRTERERAFAIAPGLRGAIDFASGLQVVPGIVFPIGIGPSKGEEGVYLYLSFEHPFRRR